MKFIKTCFLVFVLFVSNNTFSQKSELSLTAHAGANFSVMDIRNMNSELKPGYSIGLGLKYGLTDNLFFKSGLTLADKGTKVEWNSKGDINGDQIGGDSIGAKETKHPVYLILPVHLGYQLDMSSSKLNLSAGPYIGYGIFGKNVIKRDGFIVTSSDGNTTKPYTDEYKEDAFSDNSFKRIDYGISVNIGLEIQKLNFNIGYEHGLSNVSSTINSAHNRSAYLTIGYRIY